MDILKSGQQISPLFLQMFEIYIVLVDQIAYGMDQV